MFKHGFSFKNLRKGMSSTFLYMYNYYMGKCSMANQAQIMNISGNKVIGGETLALAIFNEEPVGNLKLNILFRF